MRIRFFVVAITLALTLITVGLLFHAFYDAHVELLPSRSQIYVVSLATRTDRRSRMERLRLQMGLRWTYFDATNSSDSAVYAAEYFVRAYRQRTMPKSFQDSFRWPDDAIEHSVNSLSILPSPPLTASHAIQIHSDPLTCALEDSKILGYRESMPEYKVLTHARIACWISHLEVIRRIANDFSVDYGVILEDDVDMEKDISLQLLHLWQYLPQTWDILFLGAFIHPSLLLPATEIFLRILLVGRNSKRTALARHRFGLFSPTPSLVSSEMLSCLYSLSLRRSPTVSTSDPRSVRIFSRHRSSVRMAFPEWEAQELQCCAEHSRANERQQKQY